MRRCDCPYCGANVSADGRECGYCGATYRFETSVSSLVAEGRRCFSCRHVNILEAAYCAACNTHVQQPCRNCHKLVPRGSKHCPHCSVLHLEVAQELATGISLDKAIELSQLGSFPSAHEYFEKLEKTHHDSDHFYAAWTINYTMWGKSFDADATMQSFSMGYRRSAADLVARVAPSFPGSGAIASAQQHIRQHTTPTQESGKKGCFVATAVYGDDSAPEVLVLRQWRDTALVRYSTGRYFIRWYYRHGPTLANVAATSRTAGWAARVVVGATVWCVRRKR